MRRHFTHKVKNSETPTSVPGFIEMVETITENRIQAIEVQLLPLKALQFAAQTRDLGPILPQLSSLTSKDQTPVQRSNSTSSLLPPLLTFAVPQPVIVIVKSSKLSSPEVEPERLPETAQLHPALQVRLLGVSTAVVPRVRFLISSCPPLITRLEREVPVTGITESVRVSISAIVSPFESVSTRFIPPTE